jgi:hypothetical protein
MQFLPIKNAWMALRCQRPALMSDKPLKRSNIHCCGKTLPEARC